MRTSVENRPRSRNRMVAMLLVAAVVITAFFVCFHIQQVRADKKDLKLPRLIEMREQYPAADMDEEFDLYFSKEYIDRFDAYAVVEIVERMQNVRSNDLSSMETAENDTLDRGLESIGSGDFHLTQYRIRIEQILFQDVGTDSDPDLAWSAGQEVVVFGNTSGYDSIPILEPGRSFVMGITYSDEGKYQDRIPLYGSLGMFRIVEPNHVLSVMSDMHTAFYSGMTLERFTEKILAMRNDPNSHTYVHFLNWDDLQSALSGSWPTGSSEESKARLLYFQDESGFEGNRAYGLRGSTSKTLLFISLTAHPDMLNMRYVLNQVGKDSGNSECFISSNLREEDTEVHLNSLIVKKDLIESSVKGFYIPRDWDAHGSMVPVAWIVDDLCKYGTFPVEMELEDIALACGVVSYPRR